MAACRSAYFDVIAIPKTLFKDFPSPYTGVAASKDENQLFISHV